MSNRITHRTLNQKANRTDRIDTKLSTEQIDLLLWLANGNAVDLCTEVCPDLGTVAELEGFAGHFLKRTIYRLKREGLTQKRDLFVTGVALDITPAKQQRATARCTVRGRNSCLKSILTIINGLTANLTGYLMRSKSALWKNM